jgi:SpoIID/LytB domain protein
MIAKHSGWSCLSSKSTYAVLTDLLPNRLKTPLMCAQVSSLSALLKTSLISISLLTTSMVGMGGRVVAQTPLESGPKPLAEPVIDVGIVQRFGATARDELVLQPLSGDRLTLKLESGQGTQTITTANSVKLDIQLQPLPQRQVTERVVLSTHRSFESAEDSANQWRSQGIEVEIAQPRQWQVWAKRDTYRNPLLRRLLLQNLRANGGNAAFIDTQIQPAIPKASLIVNGYRYQRDEVQISSTQQRVYITDSKTGERQLFGGNFKLQPNAYGTYTLVNQVPIETYLRGVVPYEIGLAAPPTTIEAQAILARTYALRNLRRFAIDNYQLCADTQCQVYRGLSGAATVSDRAIAVTRGLVLTYQGELVDALYSSTTGGVTARFNDVWNGPDRPYLQAVVDSVQDIWDLGRLPLSDEQNLKAFITRKDGFNEKGWDMFRWRVESSLDTIESDLRKYLQTRQHPLANFTHVKQLQVVERSPAGRVLKLMVQTDRGAIELDKDEILRALYAPNSTLFYLEPVYQGGTPTSRLPETTPTRPSTTTLAPSAAAPTPPTGILQGYRFVGGGLGHGVGMSQTGAYHLGDLGWPATRILSFYYPGTEVQPLNESLVFWRDPAPAPTPQSSSPQ